MSNEHPGRITIELVHDTVTLQQWWIPMRDGQACGYAYETEAEAREATGIR